MTQLSIDDWVARLRAAGWVDLTAAVGYQRRHRRWAITKAREWWYWFVNYRDDNIRWEHEQTLKAEGEVAAWKSTCEKETVMGNRWKDHADRLLSRAEKAETRAKELEKRVHLLDE